MYAERAAEGQRGAQIPLHTDSYRANVQSEDHSSISEEGEVNNDGTWGEHEQGGPVNCSAAMQDYEQLRQQLTHLSRTRSQKSVATRVKSNASRHSRTTAGEDIEAPREEEEKLEEIAAEDEDEDEFVLGDFLKDGHFEKRNTRGSAKKVGVIYKDLTVQGVGATSTYVKTLPSAIMGVSIYFTKSTKYLELIL